MLDAKEDQKFSLKNLFIPLTIVKAIHFFIIIGFIVYSTMLFNNFVLDDKLQIIQNTRVHSLSNLPEFFSGSTYETAGSSEVGGIYYRPLMLTIYSFLYTLFGPTPFFYHLLQLLLHIGVTIVLFLFFRKFFSIMGAFLIALLFLVHPANSESVLYISNLQDILFVFFGFLALLLSEKKQYSLNHKVLIVLFMLLSLFSKESGILFVCVIILFTWLYNRKNFRFIATSAVCTFGVYLLFRYGIANMYSAHETIAPLAHLGLVDRLMHIPLIMFNYLKLFFLPVTLQIVQLWTIQAPTLSNFWLPLLIDVCFLVVLVVGYLWIKKNNTHQARLYLFFILWFLVGLSLHIQIIPLDATFAERWFYFPIIGLLGVLGILVGQLPYIHKQKYYSIGVIGFLTVLLLLSMVTFDRIGHWKDELTLFEHDTKSQSNFYLNNLYGLALAQNGQKEKAKQYFLNSVTEYPYIGNLQNVAIIYTEEKNYPKAKEAFLKAISIGQSHKLYGNYANFLLYYDADSPESALDFAQEAIKVYPESPELWTILAQAEYLTGKKEKALQSIIYAHQLFPSERTQYILSTIEQNKPLILNQ